MYKVYITDNFINCVDDFTVYMKGYYRKFFSNTWIYWLEEIINSYIKTYDELQDDIYLEIGKKCQNWLLWRTVLSVDWDIEITLNTFIKRSYTINFYALKNNKKKEITVYDLKIQ